MSQIIKLGLGGGCHWCTEAIFSSLIGVSNVQQGWLSSKPPAERYSEGILLDIDTDVIALSDIVEVHLASHSSESNHALRDKYRSAIYYRDASVKEALLDELSNNKHSKVITQVLPIVAFKPQPNDDYVDYYYKNPRKPFCATHIQPKLKKLLSSHSHVLNKHKLPQI